jgi:hypothetical protein
MDASALEAPLPLIQYILRLRYGVRGSAVTMAR